MDAESPKGERLQKVLAAAGVASRRAAETMILNGRVTVNGKVVSELGSRVLPSDRIAVDRHPLDRLPRFRYILFNKPLGVISSALDELGRRTVLDVVQVPERIYPVGRLDRDSEGLMLLTNDGELTNGLLHPSHEIPREYHVWVSPEPTEAQLEQLRRGVVIEGGLTHPAQVTRRPGGFLSMIIHEGRKRQIRQMAESVGLRVSRLQRVRMGPLGLGALRPGEWRDLRPVEVRALAEAAGLRRGVPQQGGSMQPKVIAIDGPAGSGKTVVGKRVADALGYLYLDTGAFYRALTWLALTSSVDPKDGPALARLADSADIRIERPGKEEDRLYTVRVNRQDVTRELSTPAVAQNVSIVAAHPEVRAVLLPLQRHVAQQGRVVMAGRDIGTVVFPFAELKLYLKAPLPVRVARRIEQLEAMGMKPDPAVVAAEMAERDRLDQARATAPLKPAPDAVMVDTTTLTIDEEVALILDIVTKRSNRA